MKRLGEMLHHRDRDDFSEGDHQEYVQGGFRDVFLIGGAALIMIGAFVASLA
jgi:hypothetical protein